MNHIARKKTLYETNMGKIWRFVKLRRDKVDLENYLEQEQEQLVNKLWKQMDDLEKQKQDLITQLSDQSPPKSNPNAAVVGEVEDKSRDCVSYHETCSEQSSGPNGQAHVGHIINSFSGIEKCIIFLSQKYYSLKNTKRHLAAYRMVSS